MNKPQPITVTRIGIREYAVNDPNNSSCPVLGPYTGSSERAAKASANEDAKGLRAFYRSNWSKWKNL